MFARNITLLLSLCFTFYAQAQTVQKVEIIKNDKQINELIEELGLNELKIDLLDLISETSLDITYEKLNDPYSSYGAGVYIKLSENLQAADAYDTFSLTPFYRFYFFNKKDFGGAGFFAEIFSKISSMRYEIEYYHYTDWATDQPGIDYWSYEEEKEFNIALGAGIGQKWVNTKGWTFEINFGVGRYLINNNNKSTPGKQVSSLRPDITIRGGFGIGKRF